MKREIKYYTTVDGHQFAKIYYTGERTGIMAVCDTANFPYSYYYPHLQLYSRNNYIPQYERMASGCPCLTCGNMLANNCAAIERGRCAQIEEWSRNNERRRNPKQLTLNF